ncbi:hypothetical protein GF312_00200 [Candidatus Poribacteria bacterium]|nr:hypothetical protein [Candidatus Poribacteria bacterium]
MEMKTRTSLTIAFILLIFAWQSNITEGQVVTDGLVSYWSFDESSIDGATAKDVWGNNNGTIVGDPGIVEGMVGEALDFDGVDDYVDCGNDDSLNITEAITIEFWIFPRENAENRHVISRGEWAAGGYWIQHSDPGNVGGLYFYMDGVYQNFIVPAGSSELNIWHHFLLTYDGSMVKSYKNGEFLNEANAEGTITEKDINFMISRYAGGDLHHIDGIIDEVRVYNKALNEDEVMQNFASEGMAVYNSEDKLSTAWGKIKEL